MKQPVVHNYSIKKVQIWRLLDVDYGSIYYYSDITKNIIVGVSKSLPYSKKLLIQNIWYKRNFLNHGKIKLTS